MDGLADTEAVAVRRPTALHQERSLVPSAVEDRIEEYRVLRRGTAHPRRNPAEVNRRLSFHLLITFRLRWLGAARA
jgi:hypothetical protein